MKILILIPDNNTRGGITSYYYSIRKHLDDNFIFLIRGAKNWSYHPKLFAELIRIVSNYFNFLRILVKEDIRIVQTNTSLGKTSLIRDSIYIILSKVFRVKTIIFFHGWNPRYEQSINSIFLKIIFSTDSIIVLNNYVKTWLLSKGYKKQIYTETTLVDADLLKNQSIERVKDKYKKKGALSILFMARIEKEKGIYEAIDTFEILKNNNRDISIYIAGSGRDEIPVKNYVTKNSINNVIFLGHITGQEKIHYLESSHVYFLPSYSEGMPISVLEAMGFGLPIVTRNVGGLADIIENYENGFITETLIPEVFAELIQKLFNDKVLMLKMGLKNFEIARNRFRSDIVADRIKLIFEKI